MYGPGAIVLVIKSEFLLLLNATQFSSVGSVTGGMRSAVAAMGSWAALRGMRKSTALPSSSVTVVPEYAGYVFALAFVQSAQRGMLTEQSHVL